jgi:hypothetical protein
VEDGDPLLLRLQRSHVDERRLAVTARTDDEQLPRGTECVDNRAQLVLAVDQLVPVQAASGLERALDSTRWRCHERGSLYGFVLHRMV